MTRHDHHRNRVLGRAGSATRWWLATALVGCGIAWAVPARAEDDAASGSEATDAVEPAPAATPGQAQLDQARFEQRRLERAVQREIAQHRRLARYEIVAFADGGTVTLEGSVRSRAERRAVVALARKVEGVVSVKDRLRVSRNAPIRHITALADAVRAALDDSPALEDQNVHAQLVDRVVYLTGSVTDPQARKIAGRIASRVRGVALVRNQIVVLPYARPVG